MRALGYAVVLPLTACSPDSSGLPYCTKRYEESELRIDATLDRDPCPEACGLEVGILTIEAVPDVRLECVVHAGIVQVWGVDRLDFVDGIRATQMLQLHSETLTDLSPLWPTTQPSWVSISAPVESLVGLNNVSEVQQLEVESYALKSLEGLERLETAEHLSFEAGASLSSVGAEALRRVGRLHWAGADVDGFVRLEEAGELALRGRQLARIDGLAGLRRVDTLEIRNGGMANLDALDLETADQLILSNLDALERLPALPRLQHLDNLELVQLGVSDLAGFSGLNTVTAARIVDLDAIRSLAGLEGVGMIRLEVRSNDALTEVGALGAQGADLVLLLDNGSLASVDGLAGVVGWDGRLTLTGSPLVHTLAPLSGTSMRTVELSGLGIGDLAGLDGVQGTLVLSSLSEFRSFDGLDGFQGSIELRDLESLVDLHGLAAFRGQLWVDNVPLRSLDGLVSEQLTLQGELGVLEDATALAQVDEVTLDVSAPRLLALHLPAAVASNGLDVVAPLEELDASALQDLPHLRLEGSRLADLTGLNPEVQLQSLVLVDNDVMVSTAGANGQASMRYIRLESNDVLARLEGFSAVTQLDDLTGYGNCALPEAEVQAFWARVGISPIPPGWNPCMP